MKLSLDEDREGFQFVQHTHESYIYEKQVVPLANSNLKDVAKANFFQQELVDDLIRKGRDTERLAVARALRFHLSKQVMVYQGRTAIFA